MTLSAEYKVIKDSIKGVEMKMSYITHHGYSYDKLCKRLDKYKARLAVIENNHPEATI